MLTFVGDYLPNSAFVAPPSLRGDAIIANIEAAIAPRASGANRKAHSIMLDAESFRYIETSGAAALSVANNHAYDAGPDAFDRMIARLRRRSVPIYGLQDAPFCDIRHDGFRVLIIGCLEPCRARGARLFRQEDVTDLIRRLKPSADRVFVTPHWGKEGELACHPSPGQLRLAREWIVAGADGVFGHHPHAIHGHETIDGKPAYYSLGNYQFDHEEGREYSVAAWGLAVRMSLSSVGDAASHVFLHQANGRVAEVDTERPEMSTHLTRISATLSDPTRRWTVLRWARAVGPIYIQKSRISWRRRFQMNALSTLPFWLVWNCLPRTLLLRAGAIWPSPPTSVPVRGDRD